jgi:hypothetical protein
MSAVWRNRAATQAVHCGGVGGAVVGGWGCEGAGEGGGGALGVGHGVVHGQDEALGAELAYVFIKHETAEAPALPRRLLDAFADSSIAQGGAQVQTAEAAGGRSSTF